MLRRFCVLPFYLLLILNNNNHFSNTNNFGVGGGSFCLAYNRKPCPSKRSIKSQFAFPDCYVPSLNPKLYLSHASFVFAHNAASGYMTTNNIETRAVASYTQTQRGSVYEQLNDGARALDLRPYVYTNGTIVFHHGNVVIKSVTLPRLLQDVLSWCHDNPTELVLLFHSNMQYENYEQTTLPESAYNIYNNKNNNDNNNEDSADADADDYDDDNNYENYSIGIQALAAAYRQMGILYLDCSTVAGWTVQKAMNAGRLSSSSGGGYVLAMDRHDTYASFCGKSNYIPSQLVSCYSTNTTRNACTNHPNAKPNKNSNITTAWEQLQDYMVQSSNNEQTDSQYILGPPASLEDYPFFQTQGIWQVDTTSVATGVARVSSLLDDNTKSKLNAKIVDLVYSQQLNWINLLTIDQVQLNGNALLSVLRTYCNEYAAYPQSDEFNGCETTIDKPKMLHHTKRPLSFYAWITFYVICFLWASIAYRHYRQYYQTEAQDQQKDIFQYFEHQGTMA